MSFRALERFESQKAKYDAYKAWKAKTPQQKQALYDAIPGIATGRAKPVLAEGFIIPFNVTGTDLVYIETSKILNATQGNAIGASVATKLRAALAGQFFATVSGTPVKLKNPRYKFAKLSFTNKESYVKRESRITGVTYLKPTVDTVSMPFGGKNMSDDFDTAVASIKALANDGATAWKASSTATVKKTYKFTPEGI